MPAGAAVHAGAAALDAPVVDGLKEGLDLVLLGEVELGVVDPGEGEGAFVAGLEIGVRWKEMAGGQVKVGAARRAAVDGIGGHWASSSPRSINYFQICKFVPEGDNGGETTGGDNDNESNDGKRELAEAKSEASRGIGLSLDVLHRDPGQILGGICERQRLHWMHRQAA
ncbi:hypothetical protein J5N97_022713 [Dioscorea zingiberensis]|uniref:Uncharacterized protein n=1 Tax=Dioscorea zingiberensis TaxID=325984 RepID=A0A9D5CB33_9LILI|nr:hypothetical protein J5N97_022713 [Dioscorea zingiberensis]